MINGQKTEAFSRRHLWWQLLALFLVSVLSVYAGAAFDEKLDPLLPELYPKPSTFNRRASGLTALFEIAQQTGLNCQYWQEAYRDLNKVKGLLVIVQPIETPSRFELDDILQWVNDGNDLVYLDHFSYEQAQRILRRLELTYQKGRLATNQVLAPVGDAPECAFVKQITVSGSARIRGGQVLFKDKDGAFFTTVKYGRGRILLGTPSGFCANNSLQDKENFDDFQFMVNWLRTAPGSVFFDEKCHGFSNASNLFVFLARNAPGLVFFQLMLILAIGVVSGAQRFGSVQAIDNSRQLSSLQYVNGLANAYERAGANLAALEIIASDFRANLCKRLAISPHSTVEEINQAWQVLPRQTSSNLPAFLADYERALTEKKISAQEFDQLIQTCDKLSHEVREVFTTNSKQ